MRLIAGFALMIALAAAQSPHAKLPNEQWVKLFNGRDLSGWIEVGHEKWSVEDGTIHGRAVTKEYGYLKTDKNYKDFEMTLRFKCEAYSSRSIRWSAIPAAFMAMGGSGSSGPRPSLKE
jgi:hypothetical protein